MSDGFRYAIAEYTTPDLSFEDDLEVYRAAGATGIGIIEAKLRAGEEEAQLAALGASGLAAGPCIISNIAPLPAVEAMFPGPRDIESRTEAMCESIRRLAPFRPDTILVVTGGSNPAEPLAPQRQAAVESLRIAARVAGECGTTLSIEPIRSDLGNNMSIVQTIPETLDLIEEIGETNVLLGYDIYHLWDTKDAVALTRRHATEFGFVHLSDWRSETRSACDRAIPGEGLIDLPVFLAALDEGGYDGWYSLTLFSDDGRNGNAFADSLWARDPIALVERATTNVRACWDARQDSASE